MVTSRELILGVLEGKEYETIPIWFMRQAGRYLPEYREIQAKHSFEIRCQTPEIATEITLQPIDRFDLDAAIIFSDILIPIYAMNRGLQIKPNIGPVIDNPVRSIADIENLKQTNAKEDFPYLAESIKLTRKELKDKALIGFAGAPFTLASYLIEGKSTKNAVITKAFAYNHPDAFHKLMKLLTNVITDQLQAQVTNGVDIIQLFDSWAGFLSSDQFNQWCLPYNQEIFANFPEVKKIFYARGSNHLISSAIHCGSDAISIDTTMSLSTANQILQTKSIQGNYDPSYLLTSPNIVRKTVNTLLDEILPLRPSNYIFNLGIGIDKDSLVNNVEMMVSTVRERRRKVNE
ncbi:MAG: uroporphyrinogen decarboxylase [Candidatus Heimdallarchaeota archaeon]|nr:uroporphyrinogen decarboxylase [Candidatus Heimdallarchaeota archaeon]MDH5645789.1 uroporphyrinogen decarboxylase [Candidatus Heimdallarchaeota archaeon]